MKSIKSKKINEENGGFPTEPHRSRNGRECRKKIGEVDGGGDGGWRQLGPRPLFDREFEYTGEHEITFFIKS